MLAVAIMPALSTPMVSSSYSIPSLTISSGGHTGLQSSSYKLQDIKGQAVIGSGASSSYGLGLGGVYGTLGGEGGEISGLGTDDGLIRNTRIRIDGNDVVISWTRTSGVASADIWRSTEDYNPSGAWVKVRTGLTALEERDGGIVRNDPHSAFYRVVPNGTLIENIHSRGNNAITVGKLDLVNLPAATNLISTPLVCFTGNSINNVFSGQLDGLTFYSFDDRRSPSGQRYSETTTILVGKSYWVTFPERKTVSIVGAVPTETFNQIIYGNRSYNLIGSPTAKILSPFSSAGLPALESFSENQVYLFDNAETARKYIGLREEPFNFIPGVGYWYFHAGSSDFSWTLTRP